MIILALTSFTVWEISIEDNVDECKLIDKVTEVTR